jgi:hypothetical protein
VISPENRSRMEISDERRAALLPGIEGDWHRERQVRAGEEHRRSEKPETAAPLQRWTVVTRVELDTHKRPHLDYFYTMTSHSSHGQTADRVLIHVETELGAKDLLNSRLAHVSSRGDAMTGRFIRIMHRRSGKNSTATCPILLRFSESQERTR